MPVLRSAIALARRGVTSTGFSRPSRITKSLPSPCILSKRCLILLGKFRRTGAHRFDYLGSEAIHFLRLGAHLEQEKIQPRFLIFLDALETDDSAGPGRDIILEKQHLVDRLRD